MQYQTLLYYSYVQIADPEKLRADQMNLCQKLNLKGRIIVASEGINGTVEGATKNTEKYIASMQTDPRFADMHFKKSITDGTAFKKLSVKHRSEIVSSHLGEQDPWKKRVTGKYISAEELHDWITTGKKFYIVDMRNDYEHAIGFFKNAILPPLTNFRDLPNVLPILEHLRDETIVTVCTGGVRCEKASGFLVTNGFTEVYQLYGGIVTYMEKYPNEDFLGKLYVFDGRIAMGFHTDSPKHTIVGTCYLCENASDTYRDCQNIHCKRKRHFICCDACHEKMLGFCSEVCKNTIKQNSATDQVIQSVPNYEL